jgi:hypothetical protein
VTLFYCPLSELARVIQKVFDFLALIVGCGAFARTDASEALENTRISSGLLPAIRTKSLAPFA